jgi:hypothetical protein
MISTNNVRQNITVISKPVFQTKSKSVQLTALSNFSTFSGFSRIHIKFSRFAGRENHFFELFDKKNLNRVLENISQVIGNSFDAFF